jgi:hypothetical protein
MIHEGFAAATDGKQNQDRHIHEHQFIPTGLKGTIPFGICCITCGICYCHKWYKALTTVPVFEDGFS